MERHVDLEMRQFSRNLAYDFCMTNGFSSPYKELSREDLLSVTSLSSA